MTEVDRAANGADQDGTVGDQLVRIIAVLLIGVTLVGTAWCGYQAVKWGGIQKEQNRIATENHLEVGRQMGSAQQLISSDTKTVALYAQAVQSGDVALAQFYRQALIRPDLLPLLDEWAAQISAGQTPTPLGQNQQYLAGLQAGYQQPQQAADQAAAAARQAAVNAGGYGAATILLAAALFFAGLTFSFRYQSARIMLIVFAVITTGYAATKLVGLPIA